MLRKSQNIYYTTQKITSPIPTILAVCSPVFVAALLHPFNCFYYNQKISSEIFVPSYYIRSIYITRKYTSTSIFLSFFLCTLSFFLSFWR